VPLICRHNRFTAECPICSKGTVLDQGRTPSARPRTTRAGGASGRPAAASAVEGPYGVAGPYEGDDSRYEVRLERVPGGLRLAAWAAGSLQRQAPVLAADDLPGLISSAGERGALEEGEASTMGAAASSCLEVAMRPQGRTAALEPGTGDAFGGSPGRTGELRDELRVEPLDGGRVRIARWIARPGRGWELQEAPVMLPPSRYAEALASAAERGALCR
jgi:hypothetical protein